MTAVAFAFAAAAGGLARWRMTRLNRRPIPVGTLTVNVTGGFVAGLAAGVSATVAVVLVTAFLGSMSTFSTFAGELADLLDRRPTAAAAYVTVTLLAGITAAWIGLSVAT